MSKRRSTDGAAPTRRTLALSGLLVAQAACAAFFVVDVMADFAGWDLLSEGTLHHSIELLAVVVLVLGIIRTAIEIRRIRTRHAKIEAQLRVAAGAFLELLEERFDDWELTPSERDVALLAIKGLSIAEIAEVRRTKEGTVKAQSNAIYAKAGVTGRQQLLSLFIEDLMADGVVPKVAAAA